MTCALFDEKSWPEEKEPIFRGAVKLTANEMKYKIADNIKGATL